MLKDEIVSLCEDFITVVDKLYEKGNITEEQYTQMTKLKFEYINKMKEA